MSGGLEKWRNGGGNELSKKREINRGKHFFLGSKRRKTGSGSVVRRPMALLKRACDARKEAPTKRKREMNAKRDNGR